MAAPTPRAQALVAIQPRGLASPAVEPWLPAYGLGAVLLLCLLAPGLASGVVPWPFLIAALVLGLPHGAADGVLLLRGLPWIGRASRIAGYVLLMVLAVAALLSFPATSLVAFLALSWWHFGAADAETLRADGAPSWLRRAWGFGRGGLVIGVPLAAQPAAAWAPFGRLAELLGVAAAVDVALLGRAGAAASIAAVAALTVCAAVARRGRPPASEWVESGLILALALTVDPLLTVGAYFFFVHGFRQSAALGGELLPDRVSDRSLPRRLLALHRAALPLLLPSWLALAALVLWVQPAGARDLAILSLTLYVVATPPHHLFHDVLR